MNLRLLHACVFAASVALAPAVSADDLDDLLDEIDTVSDQDIEADPDGWAEVLALLESHFRVPGTTASSVSSVSTAPSKPLPAEDGGLAATLLQLVAAGQAPTDTPRLPDLPTLFAATEPLLRQAEVYNLRAPEGAAMTRGLRETFEQLRRRADRHGAELSAVQQASAAGTQRLGDLGRLVQQITTVDLGDAGQAAAQLAHLRTEFGALRVRQEQALARLGGEVAR